MKMFPTWKEAEKEHTEHTINDEVSLEVCGTHMSV